MKVLGYSMNIRLNFLFSKNAIDSYLNGDNVFIAAPTGLENITRRIRHKKRQQW